MNKLTSLFNKFTGNPVESGDENSGIDSKFIIDTNDPLEIKFAKHFAGSEGKFFFCESTIEFQEVTKKMFEFNKWQTPFCAEPSIINSLQSDVFHGFVDNVNTSDCFITSCEFLIADEGGIMITEKYMAGKRLSELPGVLIVVAKISQIVNKIGDGLKGIKSKYPNDLPSKITTLKGPNRVLKERDSKIGLHEPKDIFLILLDE